MPINIDKLDFNSIDLFKVSDSVSEADAFYAVLTKPFPDY